MRAFALALALLVGLGGGVARADREKDYVPWYKGPYARNRITHMSITLLGGISYYVTTRPELAVKECRWCGVDSIDSSARNAVHWKDVNLAGTFSTLDAYVAAPILGLSLLYFADKDASWRRLIDDTVPVFETVVLSETFVNLIKITSGRQRPYAHFGDPTKDVPTSDDNASFVSGHSALGFAITTSAGMICHWRHYWTEPYVWGVGLTLSLSTEYFRMAADKHYLTDVLAGGLVGVGFGLTIPRLMKHDVQIVPVPNGAAVVGMF